MVAIGASFALATLSLLIPVRVAAVLLGVLMPIDFIQGVEPIFLDLARYLVFGIVILRAKREVALQRPLLLTAVALGSFGLVTVVSGLSSGTQQQAWLGVVAVISALGGALLAQRPQLHRAVLLGFLVGVSLSAGDVLLQALGLPYLGVPSQYGLDYSGFSEKRTLLAPFLAIALILYATPNLWGVSPRISVVVLRLVGAAVSCSALILSAGRGGFVAASAAFLVWGAYMVRRRPGPVVAMLIALGIFLYSQRDQFIFDRILTGQTLEDGRRSRNRAAVEAYMSAPILGPEPSSPIALQGSYAHSPVLVFAVNAGIVGLLAGVCVTMTLLTSFIRGLANAEGVGIHAPMLTLVMLITALIEPHAFFIGLGKSVLLFVGLYACNNKAGGGDTLGSMQTTAIHPGT